MSCLTRQIQKQLISYIKSHAEARLINQPESLRLHLIKKGICPSAVTVDQMTSIISQIER